MPLDLTIHIVSTAFIMFVFWLHSAHVKFVKNTGLDSFGYTLDLFVAATVRMHNARCNML